jgi:hypothetical protein
VCVSDALERAAGVEPAPAGWKPAALPLGHARKKNRVRSLGIEPRSIAFTERRARPVLLPEERGGPRERASLER